ncbi:YSIRK-type signal peptide-containing protein [Streptococcus mitis]|uniref:YSIRK-type signal peptide-containing protein n=1 Tax=Streptococcus mitis TaxID=28037 RepID=UPI001C4EC746
MKRGQQDFRTERYLRYGIRKYSFGAASVAIAAGLMFLGTGAVSATEVEGVNELSSTATPTPTIGDEGANQGSNSSKPTTYDAEPVLTRDASEDTASSQASDENTEAAATSSSTETVADKTILKDTISDLELGLSKIARSKVPASTIANAEKVLADAKAILAKGNASQSEVNTVAKASRSQVSIIASMPKVLGVTPAESENKEKAISAASTATEAEKPVEASLAEEKTAEDAKAELATVQEDLVSYLPQAEKLATDSVVIEKAKASLQLITSSLEDANITTDELEKRVQEAKRVRNSLVNLVTGSNSGSRDSRNGQEMREGSQLLTASDYISTPNGDGTYTAKASAPTKEDHTGADIYTFTSTAAKQGDVSTDRRSGDISTLETIVYSNQRVGEDRDPGNAGQGVNNKGRMDYPLSKEQAEDLAAEAEFWKGKLRIDGSRISSGNNSKYQANGGYEYLATHIYHYAYEQGQDRVYIDKIKERFDLTDNAKAAGWTISNVEPTNLPKGLTYNADSDTIEGKIIDKSISNGVYDTRTYITYTNTQTNATVRVVYRNVRGGWIGWQDTTPPTIESDNTVHKGTVGEEIAPVDIHYKDESGSRIASTGANVSYTLANGNSVTVRHEYSDGISGISGNISTNGSTVDTAIPGLTYKPNAGTTPIIEDGKTVGYDGKGLISGVPTKAGVYHVTAYVKDFNRTDRATSYSWNYDTQEGRGELTFVIAPKVTVKNIATYDTTVPVEISDGATYAEITTPDGSKTILKTNKAGKWIVQEGTTNTAVSAGDEVGTVGNEFSLSVKPEATATAGVSKISVYAKTENVTANLMRTKVELNSATNGTKYTANLNPTSGRYELAASDATVRTELTGGNYTITKREVSTRAQTDGSMKFDLYEYTRTYNNANKVTAVNDVTLTETVYNKNNTENTATGNGMYITVKYDKNSEEWSASDGSKITANKTGDDTWEIETSSGYTGTVKGVMAENTSTSTIINSKPTARSTSYESTLNTTVNLIDRPAADTAVVTGAKVSVSDAEDDKLAKSNAEAAFKESHKTKVTSITVTDPDGNIVFASTTSGDAANYPTETSLKLTKVGVYRVTVNAVDSNTNLVDGTNVGDTTAGTDHGVNTSTATTTYTITVKAGIEGTPVTTSDIQGAVQKGSPSFNFDDAEKTKISSITNGTKVYSLESTNATDNTGATVGTYAIDKDTGEVTFTPNPTFVGTPNPAKVTLTLTVNGVDPLTSKADYTPTVIGVKPEGTKVSSTDIQGEVQKGQPTFTPGSAEVNGARKTVPLKADSYKLLDSAGTEVADGATTPAYAAADNGTVKAGDEIGTFGIDKSTGLVTFTPTNKAYVGAVKPIQVVVSDNNGTQPEDDKRGEYTPNIVGVTPTASEASTTGIQGAVQKSEVVLNAKDENVNTLNFSKGSETVNGTEKSVDLNEATLTLVGADGEGKVSVAGQGTYSIVKEDGKSYVQFTPVATYTGNVTPVTVKIADANGTEVTTTYTPKIVGVKPSAESSKTNGIQGETQTSSIVYNLVNKDENALNFVKGTAIINSESKSIELDKTSVKLVGAENGTVNGDGSVTVANQGTYKLVKDATGANAVTFTPLATFTGKAHPVTVSITDTNGTEATTTYTPSVTPVKASAEPATSTGTQGSTQSGTPIYTAPEAGTGVTVTPSYTLDNDSTTKTVDGVGTYTIDTTGKVTFVPVASYVSSDANKTSVGVKVTYRLETADKSQATITSETTYTPTVNPVTSAGNDVATTNIQGHAQKSTDEGKTLTYTISDTSHITARTYALEGADNDGKVVVENVGTYTVDDKGQVTFVPVPSYVGTPTPVTVVESAVLTSDDKTTAIITTKSMYTPTVTDVTMTSENATSTGIQGATQSGTPTFALSNGAEATTTITGYKLVDPTTGQATNETSVVVQSVGTYTIDSTTGKVTFQPDGAYKGTPDAIKVEATATVKNAKNETASITKEATYTPTVIPVTPSSKASETTGPQGQAQTSSIKYDTADTDASTVNFTKGSAMVETVEKSVELDKGTVTLLDANGAETTTVTVADQGTYSLNKDTNTITFQPLSSFVGKATPVTVQVKDANGTITTTTYTPTVTAVTPTGASSVTEGARGTIQTSPVVFDTPDQDNTTVNFNKGHEKVELDKSTLTLVDKTGKEVKEVVVPGEGTYVLKDGVVEFTPEKDFVGKATPVTVQVKDVNGKVVSETYTPTVRPVTEFKDTDGNVVSGSTTEDGKVDKKDFPGYRFVETKVDNKGNTTHIYEKVTTTFKDKEGNLITVDKDNNPVKSTEKGEIPAKTIPGYKFVETKKLPNGDIEHIYEKVTTTFKDKEGNLITVDKDNNPVKSTEEGEIPAKTIPGYKFVETKKLPNGDIEHIYEKVTTSFKDKDGNEIPNYPSEPGTVDKKDIPGYRFVETKKLSNGDIEHIYEKVSTFFKDKEGKEIPNYPSEPGTVDKKDIPGYRFVETKKLSNGDTVHVYEKVTPPAPTPSPVPQPNPGKQNTTTWTDENGNPLKPTEPGSKEPGTIPGYEYVKTVTDSNGNIRHIFRKVEMPTPTPVEPTQPAQPVEPATPAIPEQPSKPQMPATPKYVDGQKELPNTGTEANASLAALGLLGVLGGFGLLARKKKED